MRVALALILLAGTAHADDKRSSCYDELEARKVSFKKTKKPGTNGRGKQQELSVVSAPYD